MNKIKSGIPVLLVVFFSSYAIGQRIMENLDRRVIAVNQGNGKVYISWRLLINDPEAIAFNVYRSTGTTTVKLNQDPISNSTNYVDVKVDLTKANLYFVKPVVNGIELPQSKSCMLQANTAVQQYISIPLQNPISRRSNGQ